MTPRDSRARFRKSSEDLTRFGWLVGILAAAEVAITVWIVSGARGPL